MRDDSVFDEDDHLGQRQLLSFRVQDRNQFLDLVTDARPAEPLRDLISISTCSLINEPRKNLVCHLSLPGLGLHTLEQLLLLILGKVVECKRAQLQYEVVGVLQEDDAVDQEDLIVALWEVSQGDLSLDVIDIQRDELVPLLQELNDLFVLLLFELIYRQTLDKQLHSVFISHLAVSLLVCQ